MSKTVRAFGAARMKDHYRAKTKAAQAANMSATNKKLGRKGAETIPGQTPESSEWYDLAATDWQVGADLVKHASGIEPCAVQVIAGARVPPGERLFDALRLALVKAGQLASDLARQPVREVIGHVNGTPPRLALKLARGAEVMAAVGLVAFLRLRQTQPTRCPVQVRRRWL